MLVGNSVELAHNPGLETEEISNYIKQKPTRSVDITLPGTRKGHLRLYIHPTLHNWIDTIKYECQKQLKEESDHRISIKRDHKKGIRKWKLFYIPPSEWGLRSLVLLKESWLNAWEKPVVFDTSLMHNSRKQIYLYLNKKGYFNSEIKDSVIYLDQKKKKVKVAYQIKLSQPYKIRKVNYNIEDDLIKYYIFNDTTNCLIKRNKNFDVDIFEQERERINRILVNNGYFRFEKEYISYTADTNLNSHQADITMDLKKVQQPVANFPDSVIELPHTKYYINNIYIHTIVPVDRNQSILYDTLKVSSLSATKATGQDSTVEYYILYKDKLNFKPKVLIDALYLQKDALYQADNAENTYKRLSELRAFRSVTVIFEEIAGSNLLNCKIYLNPVIKHSFSLENELTNTGGNFGLAGSSVYQNKNTFKGAEIFEIKAKVGIMMQQVLTDSSKNENKNVSPFNTLLFGPEINLIIPRVPILEFAKNANPKTIFSISSNYQKVANLYSRFLTLASFGISWNETDQKTHWINPMEFTFVKVDLQPNFITSLYGDKNNPSVKTNPLLIYSYTNHITSLIHYTFQYSDQQLQKRRNFQYLKGDLELSGLVLYKMHQLAKAPTDTNGSYRIFNIPFSHYVKGMADYRYNQVLSRYGTAVFRIAGGMGITFQNLPVLPVEKAFYSGGSNGIRAWLARSIGPGELKADKTELFQQIGDIFLEGNLEYRFNMFKMMNGALFLDVGNNWLRQPDPKRPNAEFKFKNFYKQLAVGTGFGLRADFSFFIIRLDLGIKARDPIFNVNERVVMKHIFDRQWRDNYKEQNGVKYRFMVFNFGIGYPF